MAVLSARNAISFFFTTTCMVVVAFMIGYWIYKFGVEDRDIGVVDYVSIVDDLDIKIPEISLCFDDPFIERKLKEINSEFDAASYLDYLKGEIFDERYENVDFDNVTINLMDYELAIEEIRRNETELRNSTLKFDQKVVFVGFYAGYFVKCFTLNQDKENYRYVRALYFSYDMFEIIDDWFSDFATKVRVKSNYPGQFLLYEDPVFDYFEDSTYLESNIMELEILKRRRNRRKKCYENTESYDEFVLSQFMSKRKCRPPYIKDAMKVPICNSSEQMKESRYEYETRQKMGLPNACERISKMRFETSFGTDENEHTQSWWVSIAYPNEASIITQSKEVDIHALIGNIGGYLGLFMGYALVQIPNLLFWVHDYLKRSLHYSKFMSTKITNVKTSISLDRSVIPISSHNCNGACLTTKEKIELQAVLEWFKNLGNVKSRKSNSIPGNCLLDKRE